MTCCFWASRSWCRKSSRLPTSCCCPVNWNHSDWPRLEGMACEVVPIATRVGGIPELIEHGKSGYLADVADVDTMARYAIELLSDDRALQDHGKG